MGMGDRERELGPPFEMRSPFVVSTGRELFFWRPSEVLSSSGLWYRCHVQSVSAAPLGNNWQIGTVIKYEDGLCQDVLFSMVNGNQIATCPHTGRRLSWSHTVGGRDKNAAQSPVSRAIPIAPRKAANVTFAGSSNPADCFERGSPLLQNMKNLELRVQLLEKRISGFDNEPEKRKGIAVSSIRPAVFPERVLQHLRGKMELSLERPLNIGWYGEENDQYIRNDVLKCSVDCSLGEYRDLCLAMKKDVFVSSTFVPQTFGDESTVALFSNTCIHFFSFGDLCAALGESDEEKLVCSIMKARRRRTRSSPSMIRIIGDAVIPAPGSMDPLYITVGSCLSKHTMHLCKRSVPVIQRENMFQDETDMGFVYELETKILDMDRAQLISTVPSMDASLTQDDQKRRTGLKTAKSEVRGFQMQWVPQRTTVGSSIFEERSRALQRAGHLELFLPTVFCYNMSQCEELLGVCTKEFLRVCIQRMSSPP